ncbi:MAG: hypothetical protein ABEJ91_04065 [Candidatus Nanohaloarchaea archaeon]
MKRGTKHSLSEAFLLLGFLSVIPGSLAALMAGLDTRIAAGLGIGGFLLFLLGVEIYLRTRKEPQEVDVSNTGRDNF